MKNQEKMSKTKDMTNKIGNEVIERVDNYIYLGHKLKFGLDNHSAEVKRRIGWGASGKLRLTLCWEFYLETK